MTSSISDDVDNSDGDDDDEVVAGSSSPSLAVIAQQMQLWLKEKLPMHIDGVPPYLHPLPPFIPKEDWTRLGQAIRNVENSSSCVIPGRYWISIRCDGTGFGRLVKELQRINILDNEEESGGGVRWSPTLASIMIKCCRELMIKFCAKCGFTQSDEVTILIPPTTSIPNVSDRNTTNNNKSNKSSNNDEQHHHAHAYNGRLQKLCSLSAGLVTAHFNHQIALLFQAKYGVLPGIDRDKNSDDVDDMKNNVDSGEVAAVPRLALATFDCRIGCYETESEAVSLILWRSHDCGINGVSDAVHHLRGCIEGADKIVQQRTDHKLQWLQEHCRLPLHPHQRDGAYLVRRKKRYSTSMTTTSIYPTKRKNKDNEGETTITYLRSKIDHIEGNVLMLFKEDRMFPNDDDLLDSGT